MVVLKPTIFFSQMDGCNLEASSVPVNVLRPRTTSIFAEQFLCSGDSDSTDHIIDMVDKWLLVIRNGFGINLIAGFQDDRTTFVEPVHWIRFSREAVVI